jgi:GNAT superfamily N-acetyltransferase
VYVERPDGSLRCRWVKAPSNGELSHLTQFLARRIGRYLERQGLLERDAENSYLAGDGHVASIYVGPDWLRQGIGIKLLSGVLRLHPEPTSDRCYAEASIFSLPLFKRCGFRQIGSERAERSGVSFERFPVERVATTGE